MKIVFNVPDEYFFDYNLGFGEILNPLGVGTSGQYTLGYTFSEKMIFSGTGFKYNALGAPRAGTINDIQLVDKSGNVLVSFTEMNWDAKTLYRAVYRYWEGGADSYPGEKIEKIAALMSQDDLIIDMRAFGDTPSYFSPYDNLYNLLTGDITVYAGPRSGDVDGGEGNDTLIGNIGYDRFYAKGGDDYLFGGDSVEFNYLDGGAGNDKIIGGLGRDDLRGGDGDDVIRGRDGADDILGGAGNDIVRGGTGQTYARLEDGDDIYYGPRGTFDRNFIWGGDGKDTIRTGGGRDEVDGGRGDDKITTLSQDDKAWGKKGNDTLRLGTGDDVGYGNGGRDEMRGGDGNDTLYGGAGRDRMFGGQGHDLIDGGRGNDLLRGGTGQDSFVFAAGFGNDRIRDFALGQDTLFFSRDLLPMGPPDLTVIDLIYTYVTFTATYADFDFGALGSLRVDGLTSATGLAGDIVLV